MRDSALRMVSHPAKQSLAKRSTTSSSLFFGRPDRLKVTCAVNESYYADSPRTLDFVDEAISSNEEFSNLRLGELWDYPSSFSKPLERPCSLAHLFYECFGIELGIARYELGNFVQILQSGLRPDYGSSHFDIRRSASSSLTILF